MLNVYFTASTSSSKLFHEHYRKILELLKSKNCKVTSGEQIVNEEALKSDSQLPNKDIYNREIGLIEQADFIIAEVTNPSLGVGSEITYALLDKKPVLALLFKENEDKLSPLISGNPSDHLYLEHYTFENLHLIISRFLNHVEQMQKRKGKLIVVDGADGAGKSTQAQLLVDYLKKKNIAVRYIHFPRYYNSFHGKTVAKFLRGEFGTIDEVSPYLASLAYALDRASMKEEMDEFLSQGGYIVTDRYATSNMAHQGAKFKNEKERLDYIEWEYELEYKVHKIPKEDAVLYLSVPVEISTELTKKREPQKYMMGKHDIHEDDLDYQKRTQALYLELASKNNNWEIIECSKNGSLLTPEEIHTLVVSSLKKKGILES